MRRRVDVGHGREVSVPAAAQQETARQARERITSSANSRIKAVRALQARKERERSGLFYLEGIRAVAEALQSGGDVETLIVAPELLESEFAQGLVRETEQRGTTVLEVSASVFRTLSARDGPQGLAAVLRQRWLDLDSVTAGPDAVWVALDAPQDPGNVGTILRTADAAGVAGRGGLILVGPSVDPYDPSALRASTGAAFTVPLARATWPVLVAWARREGLPLVGAAGSAAVSFRDAAYPDRFVLLMGSEREGLSPAQQAVCDLLVSIPMHGKMDSLNLAVATGVILYEIELRRETSAPSAARSDAPAAM